MFEVYGEEGYVRMEGNRVIKNTRGAGEVEISVGKDKPLPIIQFLTGNILDGCSIKEANALTQMMVMAYGK